MPQASAPVPNREDQFFWDGVAEGRLCARRCASCGRLQHPPTPMCPACHSIVWTVEELSGRGRLHSWIVSRHPTEPDHAARIVALIDLEEGPRLVSNLHEMAIGDVVDDMELEVVFVDVDGVRLPQFRPAALEAAKKGGVAVTGARS